MYRRYVEEAKAFHTNTSNEGIYSSDKLEYDDETTRSVAML